MPLPFPSMLTAPPLPCFCSLQQAYSDPHPQAWHRGETLKQTNTFTQIHIRVQLCKYSSGVWETKIKCYGEKQRTNSTAQQRLWTRIYWSSSKYDHVCGELKICINLMCRAVLDKGKIYQSLFGVQGLHPPAKTGPPSLQYTQDKLN